MAARSMFEKVWDDHVVGDGLLFIDLHLVHEVTSPQAFDGLRLAGRRVRRPDRTLATADHNVPPAATSPTSCRRRSWTRSAATARSSACRCTASATAARASCT